MDLTPAAKAPAATLDSSFVIGFCAKEADKYPHARGRLTYYGAYGWDLYMPGVGIAEVLYVLCKKLQEGIITGGEYARALSSFMALMTVIKPSPNGDMTLIQRAEQIRTGYGCSRTSDGLFLALTEQLTSQGAAEIATFDIGMKNQAATNAPSVNVVTLP